VTFVCQSYVGGRYATDFLCLRSACGGVSFLFGSTFECSRHAIPSSYWYHEICLQGQFTRYSFRYTAGCHAKGGRNRTPLLVVRRGYRLWFRHSVLCNLPIEEGWKYTIPPFIGAFSKIASSCLSVRPYGSTGPQMEGFYHVWCLVIRG